MQAVILLAGYGSRLGRDDIPHKSLLPFGEETLLSRHLISLDSLGINCVYLVVGHNKEDVKQYVRGLDLKLEFKFIDNDVYRTTGNTLSMVMGLRCCTEDVVVLDGDVLYPQSEFCKYVKNSESTSFALIPADIDNTESTKTMIRPDGKIGMFVTKRDLTLGEKANFSFGGEAIGFFKLSFENCKKFIEHYENFESRYLQLLWEIPFTDFAKSVDLSVWSITQGPACFEIDTQDDYEQALSTFQKYRGSF
jgi:choline kinase